MGAGRRGSGARGGLRLSSIARVVPAVPSFSVDAGFRYAVPERFADGVRLGSMVRIPLGGRRVGGFVIGAEEGEADGLKPIAAVSGEATVFDAALADVMRWAAHHYVAPLSAMLARCAPPNNPPGEPRSREAPVTVSPPPHPVEAILDGADHRTTLWLAGGDPSDWIASVGKRLLDEQRSMLVVVATGEEVQDVARAVGPVLGGRLTVVDHEMDDAAVTRAWAQIRHRPCVLVGTPRVASWFGTSVAVVAAVEESRRAMKDRQTPTVHVRDVLVQRAARTRATALFSGAAPSLELVARGPRVLRPSGRIFPLVEVVDRREDPPGSGLLSDRVRQALRSVVARGGSAFVFAHRRGYSAASRCVKCRTLRRCAACGSRPDPTPNCRRCGAELGPCVECGGARFEPLGAGVGRVVDDVARIVDRSRVAEHPTDVPVSVGTERDLTRLKPCDLVVLVDIDGLMFGVDYRATEEAFRLGVRLAGRVKPGTGRRLVVQTNEPDHPVIVALRRADPDVFHRSELQARREMGYPPFGGLIVLEARGDRPESADDALQAIAGDATVLGPAPSAGGTRWLLQGSDLRAVKESLRPVIQRMRDSGLTVRVDVDPIDL